MRILLIGKNGQIGETITKKISGRHTIIAPDRNELDLNQEQTIHNAIQKISPAVVINAAAYTKVDLAENNNADVMRVNGTSVELLAKLSVTHGFRLIHFSSDYVFDGTLLRSYEESDIKNPINKYGLSKAYADDAIFANAVNAVIFRVSWVISEQKMNFVDKVTNTFMNKNEASIVSDQIGSITTSDLVAKAVDAVLSPSKQEVCLYNLSTLGETNWHEISLAIYDQLKLMKVPMAIERSRIQPITTEEANMPAKRPLNSRLNCELVQKRLGIYLPPWRQSLNSIVQRKFIDYAKA